MSDQAWIDDFGIWADSFGPNAKWSDNIHLFDQHLTSLMVQLWITGQVYVAPEFKEMIMALANEVSNPDDEEFIEKRKKTVNVWIANKERIINELQSFLLVNPDRLKKLRKLPKSEEQDFSEKLLTWIRREGGTVQRVDICRHFQRKRSSEINVAVTRLIDSGKLTSTKEKGGTMGRPAIIYKTTIPNLTKELTIQPEEQNQ